MKKGSPLKTVIILFMVMVVMACVTVNIYFPAAEAQKAMDTIVEEVYKKGDAPQKEKGSRLEAPTLLASIKSFLFITPAYAKVDFNISTPAIRALRKSIEGRHKSLLPYYKKGVIGIKNNGYIEIRDAKGIGLKERAKLKRLVAAENSDRKSLYKEILKANRLDKASMGELQKVAANSWRGNAQKGWWIQKDDGTWIKK